MLGLQDTWRVWNMGNVEESGKSDGGKERVWGQITGATRALLWNWSYGSRAGKPTDEFKQEKGIMIMCFRREFWLQCG